MMLHYDNKKLDLEKTLRKYWGHSSFRHQQKELCCSILNGNDVFAAMATGSGKSLIYQLPALACRDAGINATCIVVSPLISLMNDQVHIVKEFVFLKFSFLELLNCHFRFNHYYHLEFRLAHWAQMFLPALKCWQVTVTSR